MASHDPDTFESIVKPTRSNNLNLIRTLSGASQFAERRRSRPYDDEEDQEPIGENDWKLLPELRGVQNQSEKDNVKGRRLGVTWNNLTVKGIGADAAINENVGSQFKIGKKGIKAPLRTILNSSHGAVKPGEMLLVLGRPGAGCTTLMKVLANRRESYKEVTGDLNYGSMDQ